MSSATPSTGAGSSTEAPGPGSLPGPERLFNLLAGLSVLSWAYLGLRHDGVASPVRLGVSLLHLVAGSLFLSRGRLTRGPTPAQLLKTLPSFVCAGLAFRLAPPPPLWPLPAAVLFVGAALFTALSLLSLGRSFAVFPALRGVVRSGPYACVRHPAYAGELVLLAACVLARPGLPGFALLLVGGPLMASRVLAEEDLLGSSEEYRSYCEAVRFRLLPGVW